MARRDWMVLSVLLALCLAHGLWVTRGLAAPSDLDALRDIGFAQGFLDGNWFGDPAYAGAVRYYPPLVPALMAGFAWLIGSDDLPRLWVVSGPWLGLLPVVMLFLFARALVPRAALTATGVFVVWNGAIAPPWVAGGYSPWLFAPVVTQAGFLGTAWLIHARAARGRWQDAVLIGVAIGLVFLAHVIPALLLTAMLVAAVAVGQGVGWRSVGWLALAGLMQAGFMAVYLLPLLLAYPAGVVHLTPGAWVADELRPNALPLLAAMNAPWLLAAVLLGRHRPGGVAGAMLAAWIGLCGLVLARHYACGGGGAAVCTVLRMPVHHFHLYLQLAGALLIGLALHQRGVPQKSLGILLLAGAVVFWGRAYDAAARATPAPIDLPAYRWVRANAPPDAVFVTALPTDHDGDFDPGAFAVMAAGRQLVAVHTLFSNPYVAWVPREAARQRALRGCFADWAILPTGFAPAPATAAFSTATHRIFRPSCPD